MQFNALDDDSIVWIFNQFTLQQLFSLRIVCKRWQYVVELMFQNKRSLQLFASIEDGRSYWQFAKGFNDHDFIVKKFGEGGNQIIISDDKNGSQLCVLLQSLFPNVTKLVYRCKLNLVPFLKSWSNIEYLCLYLYNCEDGQEEIWSNINSMQKLKYLHLFVYQYTLAEKMPVLSRLEHFSLSYYFEDIVSVLANLGPNLKNLYLDYIPCNLDQLRQFIEIQPEIVSNLTHLTVVNIRSSQSSVQDRKYFLRLICNNFASLTHLDVKFTNQIPLTELLSDLSCLKHLKELKLQISCILPESIHVPFQPPTPLVSVKTLYLILCKPYDGTHLSNFDIIPKIFPMIEELFIQSYNEDLMPSLKKQLCHFANLRKTNLAQLKE